MATASWKRLVVIASVAFTCAAIFGSPLFFAPGWANRWPFGLTIHGQLIGADWEKKTP